MRQNIKANQSSRLKERCNYILKRIFFFFEMDKVEKCLINNNQHTSSKKIDTVQLFHKLFFKLLSFKLSLSSARNTKISLSLLTIKYFTYT